MQVDHFLTSLSHGASIIAGYVKTLTLQPGVYRMVGADGRVLYVGKAKNLRKRVTSYTQTANLPLRLQRMVSQVASMDFVTTNSEVEALLLEANLIKKWKPEFNVLLKDDKAYAYITFSQHEVPQVLRFRGVRKADQSYYGPFASAQALDQTLLLLQKIFRLRTCGDSDFATRKRPCLKYHIKQCSAPCVGWISAKDYQDSVRQAERFLKGQTAEVQKHLVERMSQASSEENFEQAALIRDQIRSLAHVQSQQMIHVTRGTDFDVIGVAYEALYVCVQIFVYRGGANLGNLPLIVQYSDDENVTEVLASLLLQFYQDHEPPPEILLPSHCVQANIFHEAVTQLAQRTCQVAYPKLGDKKKLVDMAHRNAQEALTRALVSKSATQKHLTELASLFQLSSIPLRIEVYDNSHLGGTYPLGAMVVAGAEGFEKKHYRRFYIRDKTIAPGDDYAMMEDVIRRRFQGSTSEQPDPDLILVDGGKGQLRRVHETLQSLGKESIAVLAIAKGPDRNAGRETFFMQGLAEPFHLPPNHPVLFFLQRLRDEAHRYAITGNRKRRESGAFASILDQLPGVGPRKKKALLHHFGSAKAVTQAGIDDLKRVDGISETLATQIYNFIHEL